MAAWREIEASAQWYSAVGDTHPSATDGSPCHCTFYLPKPVSKIASKLDWLRDRPDMQTVEGQALLNYFEKVNDQAGGKLDPLLPWLAREVKKGRILHSVGGAAAHQEALNPNSGYVGNLLVPDELGVPIGKNIDPTDLRHMADWYADKHAPSRKGVDLMQHTYPEISEKMEGYDQWLKDQQAKADAKNAAGAPVAHDYGDGWTLRKLRPEDLKYEGDAMGHCVGGYGYGDAVQRGEKMIFSLRDPKHEPHATLEMEPRYFQDEKGNLIGGQLSRSSLPEGTPAFPRIDKAYITQIQGKGNEVPNPEYQKRLKQWFETMPEEDRPNWADDNPITDVDHFDRPEAGDEDHGYLGGYGPHGDYGLPDHRSVDWSEVLDNSLPKQRNNWRDQVDPNLLYEHARARGEIPDLADALSGFHDEQLVNFDQWRDMNYEFTVPFPQGDEEYPYELPNGNVVNNESEHEDAAYRDSDQWERDHPGMNFSAQLYSLLAPHYQEAPAGQYVNELQGDPTAVAKAQNSDLRTYWQHPAQADWNTQQQPRQARWALKSTPVNSSDEPSHEPR